MSISTSGFKIQHFLLFWFLINVIQGAFMELHVDESYYWVYSKFLDWGYYDHPPMTAIFIKIGNLFSHSTLAIRGMTILTNTIAIYYLWKIVQPYASNVWLFTCLYCSFVIFHVFGFITSPDSPLLFFAILYLYFLQKYLIEEKAKATTILLLTIAITGMLYSKYHAVLLLFFTLLAEWKLLKRPSFWLIVLSTACLYAPHILWQIQNEYPSIQYHVLERNARAYKIAFTTDYLTSLLLVVGPFTGWYLYYQFVKQKSDDRFIRILKFIFWGFILFFLFASTKSYVQAQWVLLAYIPFFIVAYIYLANSKIPQWFYPALYSTIGLVFMLRIILIVPIPFIQNLKPVKAFWGKEDLAQQIHKYAKDRYVIFDNGFQDPSSYNYYNNSLKGFAYDSRAYRKTQYDYWPLEDSLRNKNVYRVQQGSFDDATQDTIETLSKGTWYGKAVDSIRLYQRVDIHCTNLPDTLIQGKTYPITLTIYNPYDEPISFSNEGQKWKLFFEYGFTQYIWDQGTFFEVPSAYQPIIIPSKQSIQFDTEIHAPLESGHRLIMFSLRTEPFSGARNSKKHPIYVLEK